MESSPTPIYQRIINAFSKALSSLGHTVDIIDIEEGITLEDYISFVRKISPDFILVTNPRSIVSTYVQGLDKFVFQMIETQFIFIHHDNIFSNLIDVETIQKKLNAWISVKNTSWHFCLEYDNFLDLRNIGVNNCFSINHASEFQKSKYDKNYNYDLSFVGHVLPRLDQSIKNLPFSHLIQADIWNRITNLPYKLSERTTKFAANKLNTEEVSIKSLCLKYFYMSCLHTQSHFFRGEIISRLISSNIDIIGGDPKYLHGIQDGFREITKTNVRYHNPTNNDEVIKSIYASSKINLNITSLQFDSTVINRVIDVAAAGGFILTDWRSDLSSFTSVHKEISYKSIEELNEKASYYLHPDHQKERIEIADTLHQEISRKYTYINVVQDMIAKINSSSSQPNNSPNILCIDLGCGDWKPEGFIGVDIASRPNVDVVANLNSRFPFPDSSADIIRAHDVIEHLEDRIHTMNELWRVAKPDGVIDIRVPSTDGRGAFQDPTHISFWNINSFMYYCVEHPAYLNLNQIYGFKGAFRIESMEHELSEGDVVHVRALLRVVKECKDEKYNDYINELKSINILVCPDWQEDEESLYKSLRSCLSAIFHHPQKKDISILIGITERTPEYIDTLLSDIALDLIFEENIDVSDGEPNLIFIPMKDHDLLKFLEPHIDNIVSSSLELFSYLTDVK
ncbi:glycosyltransferase [Pseudanabaena sp. FACHB-723]|uniref:Glycosyltransferase n=2 Tax=Pseudanabaena mucicola TaxID=71190 RepID=A0ABR8A2K4_9CYAN|nr:glycosyltransferase [Pseudanabaena mucicola FACHB-723]